MPFFYMQGKPLLHTSLKGKLISSSALNLLLTVGTGESRNQKGVLNLGHFTQLKKEMHLNCSSYK